MRLNDRAVRHLEAGGIVLTRNLRQARVLRRLHDAARIAAGASTWPTAQVMPLDAWLAARWREAADERPELPVPMPPTALEWMWRRQAGARASGLLDPAELGRRARASWLALRAHGGGLGDLARWPSTRDQQAFAAWAREIESALEAQNACDPGDLAVQMLRCDVVPAAGPPLLLAGFRRPAPAIERLCESLAHRGWALRREPAAEARAGTWQHAAADPESERAALWAWLRERVERQPEGIHAAILPGLQALRGAVERELASALQPALELPGAAGAGRLFDLAGGHPLSAAPVVADAFDAIGAALGDGDWRLWSRLLRSRHLGAAAGEGEARTRLDLRLRAGAAHASGTRAMASMAQSLGAAQFAKRLEAASNAVDGPPRRGASAWAEAFGACLAAWGWPGEAPLDSAAYQAADRLRECLRELAGLAMVAPALGATAARREFGRLCARPFQPESGEPLVFLLDDWEDPGFDCDSLWVAGLSAAAWPRPLNLDPLLPIELQRRLGMPGASAADCARDAAEVIEAWRGRAGALVLSWPRQENDTEVDGSTLADAGHAPLSLPPSPPSRERLACGSAALVALDDDEAPPLGAAAAKGGARVLELQSACPFRAFAELRLRAGPLEAPRDAADRRLRGQLLHRAMEGLWKGLGTHGALLALAPEERRRRAEAAVDEALAALWPATGGERSRGLERDWQRLAVTALLDRDHARPGFEVVATERAIGGRIGGIELELRIDRVDRVDGGLLLIDYKTGRARASAWRGARMDAPQLPLYAVLHPGRTAGIAFAEARPRQARHVGVGAAPLFDGLAAAERFALTEDRRRGFGWEEIVRHWHAWLEQLARQHAEGRAAVDPKLGADTCRHCHLGALCRVAPDVEPAQEEDADDE